MSEATTHVLPPTEHQFEDLNQQHESSSLGMWVFLIQEIMFFGGMFAAYTLYRFLYHDAWVQASHHLDVTLGALNTGVLLTSSLTMALAVRAAQMGKRDHIVWFLIATMILGCVFLGVKVVEYEHKFEENLVPGKNFKFEGDAPRAQIFFSLYFAMTGMHALHMIIGVGLMVWLIVKARRNQFSKTYYFPVEMGGLYWHFVDIVWVFLFPLLYLVDRSGGAH